MHTTRPKARAIAIARTMDEQKKTAQRLFIIASGAICALSVLAIATLV